MSISTAIITIFLLYFVLCVVYFFAQEGIIFRGRGVGQVKDYRLTNEWEEHFLQTPNNGKIHYLRLRTQDTSKGSILFLHGNTGHLKRWSLVAQELCALGYEVWVPDYRGYGKSNGPKKEEWMHQDLFELAHEMEKSHPGGKKLLFGRSLGSGFAVRLASRIPFDGLILETPFLSLLDVAKRQMPWLPMNYLLRYPFRSDRYIQEVKCPILMIHGTKDRIVAYASAYALYQCVADRKNVEMLTIAGGNHGNLNAYAVYWERLRDFCS